jgi:hypothetical protein
MDCRDISRVLAEIATAPDERYIVDLIANNLKARRFEEMAEDPIPVSLINQPLPPDNVRTLVRPNQRPLHAVLGEALTNTQALLTRLEVGVTVPRQEQREVVRLLYVATRHQVRALAATLELEGLE